MRHYQVMVINLDNNMARMLNYEGFGIFDVAMQAQYGYKEQYPDELNYRITLIEELFK